nr:MAG TPA: hypothetical protein [Caudoviricetes sp.]
MAPERKLDFSKIQPLIYIFKWFYVKRGMIYLYSSCVHRNQPKC